MLMTTMCFPARAGNFCNARPSWSPPRGARIMFAATEPPNTATMKSASPRATGSVSGSRWKNPRLFVYTVSEKRWKDSE